MEVGVGKVRIRTPDMGAPNMVLRRLNPRVLLLLLLLLDLMDLEGLLLVRMW